LVSACNKLLVKSEMKAIKIKKAFDISNSKFKFS